jgi:hypothetical protein
MSFFRRPTGYLPSDIFFAASFSAVATIFFFHSTNSSSCTVLSQFPFLHFVQHLEKTRREQYPVDCPILLLVWTFILRGLEDGPASVAGNALFYLAHLAFQYRSRNRCSVVAFARNRHPQPGICGESIKAVISSEPQLTVNDTDIRSYRNVRTITRWNKSPDNGRRHSYLRQFFASANRIYSTDEENLPLLT